MYYNKDVNEIDSMLEKVVPVKKLLHGLITHYKKSCSRNGR